MRQLVITSGKGGTGKTTLAACFVALARRVVAVDADVDAPNLHLVLRPRVREEREFRGAKKAVKEEGRCTGCGECAKHCRSEAIREFGPDPFSCEGCGVCAYVCPSGALRLEEVVTGRTMISETAYGPLSHAFLEIGAEASGKLVTAVRRRAEELGQGEELLIIDGAPGIGCPVIASLTGADLALLVAEPSCSSLHDLARVLGVARHFEVPALVCINKYDLCPELSAEIADFCAREGVELAGKIPFDPGLAAAQRHAAPAAALLGTKAGRAIEEVWEAVRARLFPGR